MFIFVGFVPERSRKHRWVSENQEMEERHLCDPFDVALDWTGVVREAGKGAEELAGTDCGVFEQAHQEASDLLKVWSVDVSHPQEEYLDCLLAQIRKLRQDN